MRWGDDLQMAAGGSGKRQEERADGVGEQERTHRLRKLKTDRGDSHGKAERVSLIAEMGIGAALCEPAVAEPAAASKDGQVGGVKLDGSPRPALGRPGKRLDRAKWVRH